jgi:hypothetical protein
MYIRCLFSFSKYYELVFRGIDIRTVHTWITCDADHQKHADHRNRNMQILISFHIHVYIFLTLFNFIA